MVGLIYKDLMVMKKTLLIYRIISVFYGCLDIRNSRTGMMFAMVLITSTMVPISSIAYDERSKWDKIVNTTPLSRKEVVISKYLLALVLTVVSTVVVFVVYLFKPDMPLAENAGTSVVMGIMSVFYQAMLIPTIIKFGSEKGRMIMMIILFAPFVLLMAVAQMEIIDLSALAMFLESNTAMLPFITVAVTAAVYIGSILLSVSIYEKKDL